MQKFLKSKTKYSDLELDGNRFDIVLKTFPSSSFTDQ